jgi:hypothetical protein
MIKPSKFLADIHSHGVYKEPYLSEVYKQETGLEPAWEQHTVGATNCSVGSFKGLVNEIKTNESDRCSYGYEIAVAIAEQLIPGFTTVCSGRGFQFQEAVGALLKSGY